MKLLSSVIVLTLATVIGGFAIHSATQENANYDQQVANHWGSHHVAKSYILQGANASSLNAVVANVGGNVSREFPIINAVSAMLTSKQADEIRALGGVRIQDDRTVMTMNTSSLLSAASKQPTINNYIAQQVGANNLHDEGITGDGVTVVVVDSGANFGGTIGQNLFRDTEGRVRVYPKYDATTSTLNYIYNDDQNGHGTHVSSIIASSLRDADGNYNGIAPDVNLLSIKAFDQDGSSSYSKVLDALNWTYENRYRYSIRVVNMSLGADPQSYYWDDPINQAIMKLWNAGIVIVSSAGNNGQDQGITVPGNNPYVITVGAVSDNQTPLDFSDDRLSTFSSKGPTVEGFVKPEVLAYGSQIASKMDERLLVKTLKESIFGDHYSEISGTSQSAALVSGIAALIISNDMNVTPNDVKCRIMNTARTGNDGNRMTYSPFEQGMGIVNAYAAVKSTATNCANVGLNITEDLQGINHFVGPARQDANGEFYIDLGNGVVMLEGNHWGNGAMELQGNHWGNGAMELQGNHWGNGAMELQGNHWGNGALELQGNHWGNGAMELQGNHWGNGAMLLQGNHWGNGALELQGIQWDNGALEIQSTDLNPTPIDPNAAAPVDESSWQ